MLSSDTDTDSLTDRIIDNCPKKKCKIGLLHELAVLEANLDFPVADGSTEVSVVLRRVIHCH